MAELRLSELLELTRDGEWGESEPADGLVRMQVIRGTDFERVRSGDLSSLPIRYIRKAVADRKVLKAGDILIETAGGTKDQPTGRTLFVTERMIEAASDPLIPASFARFLRPRPGAVEPEYLFWKLQEQYATGALTPFHVQHTGVARFQFTQFAADHVLDLASDLSDQRRIASTLSLFDQKIELNRRLSDTLEGLAQAIFRDWFFDFGPIRRKLQGVTDPVHVMGGVTADPERALSLADAFPSTLDQFDTPTGWAYGSVADLIEFNPPERLAKAEVAPYLEMSALPTRGPIADAAVNRPFGSGMRFRNGDALLARITPCLENGKACYVDNLPEGQLGWGSTEFFVLRARPPAPGPLGYLFCRHPEFRAVAVQSMTGTSGRQRAQLEMIKSFPMALPPARLLRGFSDLVCPLFARIGAAAAENRTLSEARDYLLPKLIAGQVTAPSMQVSQ